MLRDYLGARQRYNHVHTALRNVRFAYSDYAAINYRGVRDAPIHRSLARAHKGAAMVAAPLLSAHTPASWLRHSGALAPRYAPDLYRRCCYCSAWLSPDMNCVSLRPNVLFVLSLSLAVYIVQSANTGRV